MLKATRFMVEKASTRGGYVWAYLPDLSRRWTEMEAFETQIAIQSPGTPSMGQLFLDAYRATGDEYYYCADKVARAICGASSTAAAGTTWSTRGNARREWYATIGKNAWRLEEFALLRQRDLRRQRRPTRPASWCTSIW
jgi:hypothetical protein